MEGAGWQCFAWVQQEGVVSMHERPWAAQPDSRCQLTSQGGEPGCLGRQMALGSLAALKPADEDPTKGRDGFLAVDILERGQAVVGWGVGTLGTRRPSLKTTAGPSDPCLRLQPNNKSWPRSLPHACRCWLLRGQWMGTRRSLPNRRPTALGTAAEAAASPGARQSFGINAAAC